MKKEGVIETGRLRTRFRDIQLIGEGGFGKAYKAYGRKSSARRPFAIKVVRLHVLKTENVVEELYNHRVYREVLGFLRIRRRLVDLLVLVDRLNLVHHFHRLGRLGLFHL